jgi:hypothetical protein
MQAEMQTCSACSHLTVEAVLRLKLAWHPPKLDLGLVVVVELQEEDQAVQYSPRWLEVVAPVQLPYPCGLKLPGDLLVETRRTVCLGP